MKNKEKIRILAIESSCDETAAAVIGEDPSIGGGQPVILSNIISSQVDLHAKTGGVVPEVASRAHVEAIIPVICEALIRAQDKLSIIKYQGSTNDQVSSTNTGNLEINNLIDHCDLTFDTYGEAIRLLDDITHISVTAGPGLIGSLLVGFNAAKTIAYSKNLPIIPINHIEGHIYSVFNREFLISNFQFLNNTQFRNTKNNSAIEQFSNRTIFPLLALTVSGGHTSLTLMKDHGQYEQLGCTLDDAAGEAYDKVAKLLNLGYPGGPVISEYASRFRNKFLISNSEFLNKSKILNSKYKNNITIKQFNNSIIFPRPIINDGTYNFSLSGLKTSVLTKTLEIQKNLGLEKVAGIPMEIKEEIAAAFEESVADVLATKTARAVEEFKPRTVIFAGGVSANKYLASKIQSATKNSTDDRRPTIDFMTPARELTGDNAAMIGLAAYYHIKRGDVGNWQDIKVDSNWELV